MSSETSGNRKRPAEETDENKSEAEEKESFTRPAKAPRRLNEDEPPLIDPTAEFKWRGDPDETFSDWKIEIVTTKEIPILDKVAAIYKQHNPAKLNELDKILEVYSGDEEQLLQDVKDKYFKKDCEDKDKGEEDDNEWETVVQSYYVHRSDLVCGTRKSDYFANAFRAGNKFREGKSQTSRIELHPLAAGAFPDLLDYVYSTNRPLKISVETATALHHLGEYFEIEPLRFDSREFIKKEMNFETAATFHKHARLFQDASILDLVTDFVAKNIEEFTPSTDFDDDDPHIVEEPDPELWKNVLKQINSDDKKVSECASSAIVDFVSSHISYTPGLIDRPTFLDLTDANAIPHIDYRSALLLTKYDDEILPKEAAATEPPDSTKNQDDAEKTLSSLQERCATALSKRYRTVLYWVETDHASENPTLRELQERKPSFLVDLLVKSWKEARGKSQKYKEELATVKAKLDSALALLRKFKPIQASEAPKRASPQAAFDRFGATPVAVPPELVQANPSFDGQTAMGYRPDAVPPLGVPVFFYNVNGN